MKNIRKYFDIKHWVKGYTLPPLYSFLPPTQSPTTFDTTIGYVNLVVFYLYLPVLITGVLYFIIRLIHHKTDTTLRRQIAWRFFLFLIGALLLKLFVINCVFVYDYGVPVHQVCFVDVARFLFFRQFQ